MQTGDEDRIDRGPGPMGKGLHRPPPPGARWAAMLLFAALAAPALAGALQWEHYRALLAWQRMGISPADRVLIFWTLASSTAVLLVPVLAVAGATAALGRGRAAWWILGIGTTLVASWIAIDLRIQEVTGNHVFSYLQYAGAPGAAWQMAGSPVSIVVACAWIVGIAALATAAGCAACAKAVSMAAAARTGAFGRRPLAAATVLVLAAAAAGFPAGGLIGVPGLAARIRAAQPVDLPFLPDAPDGAGADRFRMRLGPILEESWARLQPAVAAGGPADDGARLTRPDPPNLVLIILESFRHDILGPEGMPRLHAWSRGGLRFERHYAGANVTQLGVFALLYGRSPLAYEATLAAGRPPPMAAILRRSGYRTAFASGLSMRWRGMEEFINERTFDRLLVRDDEDWPAGDRWVLEEVRRQLEEPGDRPLSIVAFLNSTHFNYRYPPEYEKHLPARGDFPLMGRPGRHRRDLLNRYRNAALFLDDAIADLVARLDPRRNLIVVTGDHGESIFDDGKLAHCGHLTDMQTRVPLVAVGPGIAPGTIGGPTSHVDLLPTILHALAGGPVPLRGSCGRDVLADPAGKSPVLLWKWLSPGTRDLVFIRGDRRLKLTVWPGEPRIRVVGFCDANGAVDPTQGAGEDEAEAWAASLEGELRKIAK